MSIFKGWFGEKVTTFNMWLSLDKGTYRRVHNIIIPSRNGTTQIDHLVISRYGLFIVETKHRKGWVFGSENQKNWTQVTYHDKYSFQNPLRQTYRQKKVLAEFLGIKESIIHTVIYFSGDVEFKTSMPQNVLNSGLARYIKRHRSPLLFENSIEDIEYKLKNHKTWSSLTNRDHVKSLKRRHQSNSHCPRCGSELVLRTAKQGPSAGSQFYGCSNYPKCRFSKNI